jgi:hypothetical protein
VNLVDDLKKAIETTDYAQVLCVVCVVCSGTLKLTALSGDCRLRWW